MIIDRTQYYELQDEQYDNIAPIIVAGAISGVTAIGGAIAQNKAKKDAQKHEAEQAEKERIAKEKRLKLLIGIGAFLAVLSAGIIVFIIIKRRKK